MRQPRRLGDPALPTYRTVAEVLEQKNGAGLRLVGWTVARACLIVPPMIAVGVDGRRAIGGSLIASSLISLLTLARVRVATEG